MRALHPTHGLYRMGDRAAPIRPSISAPGFNDPGLERSHDVTSHAAFGQATDGENVVGAAPPAPTGTTAASTGTAMPMGSPRGRKRAWCRRDPRSARADVVPGHGASSDSQPPVRMVAGQRPLPLAPNEIIARTPVLVVSGWLLTSDDGGSRLTRCCHRWKDGAFAFR